MSQPVRYGEDARMFLSLGQMIGLGAAAVGVVGYLLLFGVVLFLQMVLGVIIAFYALFVGMKVVISMAGFFYKFTSPSLPSVDDPGLPRYTVLVPLYKETGVLPGLVQALRSLQYPAHRLNIILVIEADDQAMIAALEQMNLPRNFTWREVPVMEPRTKPKACDWVMTVLAYNQAFRNALGGDRLVIFDAEDRPEPLHMLKAVAGLDAAHLKDPRVVCVQGQLKFSNPREGLAAAFLWAEYIVHYRWTLPGMAKLGLIPPLGGTSNHFFMWALDKVAEQYEAPFLRDEQGSGYHVLSVWDAFNVTEDADLAARLARCGYRIGIVDAVTYEKALAKLGAAINQRSRWLKGYDQTGLVHSRRPLQSMSEMGPVRYLCFNFFMLGTPLSLILNPIMWSLTIFYIVSRAAAWHDISLFIDGLFVSPIYYAGMLVAVGGNFFLLVQKVWTVQREVNEESPEHAGLALRLLLGTPLWWAATCVSAYRAAWQLLIPGKRFFWDKTDHGEDQEQPPSALAPAQTLLQLPAAQGQVRQMPAQPADQARHRLQ